MHPDLKEKEPAIQRWDHLAMFEEETTGQGEGRGGVAGWALWVRLEG